MSSYQWGEIFESREATPVFQQADADVIIRMLYFCADEPRMASQIMVHCNIDRSQLVRFSRHCIRRKLLKIAFSRDGDMYLETTEHGTEVLSTAQNIMYELGIKLEEPKIGKPDQGNRA